MLWAHTRLVLFSPLDTNPSLALGAGADESHLAPPLNTDVFLMELSGATGVSTTLQAPARLPPSQPSGKPRPPSSANGRVISLYVFIGRRYPPYNLPGSVLHWITNNDVHEDFVVKLDGDMARPTLALPCEPQHHLDLV